MQCYTKNVKQMLPNVEIISRWHTIPRQSSTYLMNIDVPHALDVLITAVSTTTCFVPTARPRISSARASLRPKSNIRIRQGTIPRTRAAELLASTLPFRKEKFVDATREIVPSYQLLYSLL